MVSLKLKKFYKALWLLGISRNNKNRICTGRVHEVGNQWHPTVVLPVFNRLFHWVMRLGSLGLKWLLDSGGKSSMVVHRGHLRHGHDLVSVCEVLEMCVPWRTMLAQPEGLNVGWSSLLQCRVVTLLCGLQNFGRVCSRFSQQDRLKSWDAAPSWMCWQLQWYWLSTPTGTAWDLELTVSSTFLGNHIFLAFW